MELIGLEKLSVVCQTIGSARGYRSGPVRALTIWQGRRNLRSPVKTFFKQRDFRRVLMAAGVTLPRRAIKYAIRPAM